MRDAYFIKIENWTDCFWFKKSLKKIKLDERKPKWLRVLTIFSTGIILLLIHFYKSKFWDKDHHIGHFEQLRWLFHSFEKKFTGLFNRNLNEMFQIFLFWTFRKQTLLKIHNELSKSAHIINYLWAIWAHIIWLI